MCGAAREVMATSPFGKNFDAVFDSGAPFRRTGSQLFKPELFSVDADGKSSLAVFRSSTDPAFYGIEVSARVVLR